MDIISTVKYSRVSPRKIRLLARKLAKTSTLDSERYLGLRNDKGAKLILGALKTAVADAKNNFKKTTDELEIKTVEILEGNKMKRFRPVSRGMAHTYKRRTSHIKVTLTDKSKKTS